MGRAFLSGGFWGLAVSAVVVVLVSQGERRQIATPTPAPPVVTGDVPDDVSPPPLPTDAPPRIAPPTNRPDATAEADAPPAAPVPDQPPVVAPPVPPAVSEAADAPRPVDAGDAAVADLPVDTAPAPVGVPAPPEGAGTTEDAPPQVDRLARAPVTPAAPPQDLASPNDEAEAAPARPAAESGAPVRGADTPLAAPAQAPSLPGVAADPAALPPAAGPTFAAIAPEAPVAQQPDATAPRRPAKATAPTPGNAPAAPEGPGPLAPGQPDVARAPEITDGPESAPEMPVVIAGPPEAPPPRAPDAAAPDTLALAPDPAPAPVNLPAVPGLSSPDQPGETPDEPSAESQPLPAPLPMVPAAPDQPGQLPKTDAAPPQEIAAEPEVVTDRLPRIGDGTAPVTDAEAPQAVLAADALTRNGETFDNPDGRPIVAVVLLDGGGPLIRLPVTVSVAIDAAAPDAATRSAAYREAGVEVVLIPDLPQGARASDVSVALADTFARIPDAVALIDTPDGAMQDNREALGQVVSELGDTGHGLITYPKGLNTAQQVAVRGDVTAGLVFRQIDSEGQDLRAVKRFLDQAAFRARQEEAVILVGRNRPETLAALAEWALGNRAASVALAPVSAALGVLGR